MKVLSFSSSIYKFLAAVVFAVGFLASAIFVTAQESVAPAVGDDVFVGGPEAPVVNFSAASNDGWVIAATSTTFSWELSEGITAVAVAVKEEAGTEPDKAYRPPVSEFTIDPKELSEGLHYLSVQFKNETKWGYITEVSFWVDNTPPEPFNIKMQSVNDDGGFVLSLEAIDTLSGIDHYEVSLDDRVPLILSDTEAEKGFVLVPNKSGDHNILVKAFDKAGNVRENSVTALLGSTDKLLEQNKQLLDWQNKVTLLIGLLSLLILLMLAFLVSERRRYAKQLLNIKVETEEIHQQLVRIFNALRDEVYDQIRAITKKPKLSKAEKEAVESLDKALQVSESLIEKEIADVKNIVK